MPPSSRMPGRFAAYFALSLGLCVVAGGIGCAPGPLRARLRPPAARIEPTPAPRSADQTWIPGDWMWERSKEVWAWRGGYYTKRPDGASDYQRGRWVRRGYRWVWFPGRWILGPRRAAPLSPSLAAPPPTPTPTPTLPPTPQPPVRK